MGDRRKRGTDAKTEKKTEINMPKESGSEETWREQELEGAGAGSPEHRGGSQPSPACPHPCLHHLLTWLQEPQKKLILPGPTAQPLAAFCPCVLHAKGQMGVHLRGAQVLLLHLHLEPDALEERHLPNTYWPSPGLRAPWFSLLLLSPRDWRRAQPTTLSKPLLGTHNGQDIAPAQGAMREADSPSSNARLAA